MIINEKIEALKKNITKATQAGQTIGFVPTMGYFHEGHLTLIRRARSENEMVVVSLFVNPLQFGPQEDLARYPRDLKRDSDLADQEGVDLLFIPTVAELYPKGFQTKVEVAEISQGLCGGNRPGHFAGVATVVLKLFNLVKPQRAYFGEKDAQQLRVVKQMVQDLNLDLKIVGCPIVREADGLAMSSRNVYLNSAERQAALILSKVLQKAEQLIAAGEDRVAELKVLLKQMIATEPLAKLDYLEILNSSDLQPIEFVQQEILVAVAVRIGQTRLIDNIVIRGCES